ncbi:hypothetical protein D3C72_1901670 [compost metagenome]
MAEAGRDRKPHMALQALAHIADQRIGSRHLAEDIAPVLVQPGAHRRGLDMAGGPPQQLHAQLFFQRLQPVADIGARHLELARGRAQVAGIDNVDEQAQGVEIHGSEYWVQGRVAPQVRLPPCILPCPRGASRTALRGIAPRVAQCSWRRYFAWRGRRRLTK